MAGQAAAVPGNLGAVAGHDHPVQGDPDVDPAAEAYEVPLLSVQPLVENAVYHGIERLAAPGTVRIAAHAEQGALRVEVHNPRPDAEAPSHHGQRIAVDNIAQRLALIYGEGQARLALGEEEDRFVSRLTLPIIKAPA